MLEVSFFEFSKNQSNLNSNRSMIVNFSSTTLPGLARIGRPSQHWIRLNLVLGVNLSLQYRYYYIWVYGVPGTMAVVRWYCVYGNTVSGSIGSCQCLGSGFKGLLDPDPDPYSESGGLKKGQKCYRYIIMTLFNFLVTFTTFYLLTDFF